MLETLECSWNAMERYSLQKPICNQQVAGLSPIASFKKIKKL
jgi:hypothetical protein